MTLIVNGKFSICKKKWNWYVFYRDPHALMLQKYVNNKKKILFLGMNPGYQFDHFLHVKI